MPRVTILAARGRLRLRVAASGSGSGGGSAPAAAAYGAARVDLTWPAVAGAASYEVQRSPSGAGTWSAVATPTDPAYHDTGLDASTAYDYRVRASGGAWSPPASATTGAAGTPPTAPIEFNAAPFSSSVVNVTWNPQGGTTYFAVQRSPDGVTGWQTLGVPAAAPFSDSGLPPGATYYYRVVGGNAGGETAMTDTNSGADGPQTTYPAGAPTLPASHGLTAAPLSPNAVQVRWLQVQTPEGVPASSYLLERSGDGGATWSQVASQAGTVLTDSGLTASAAYSYRFRAVGAGGTSAPSSTVAAATPAVRSGRSLLQPQDFTYLGSFQPPFYVDPAGPPPTGPDVRSSFAQTGIALRYVGGQLRFLGLTSQAQAPCSQLYEYTPPASLSTAPPFPAGTPVKFWGDPYGGKKLGFDNSVLDGFGSTQLADIAAAGGEWSSACFMDPSVANRVWVTYANWYNVTGNTAPSVLRCDLDDANGTLSTTGPYRFDENAAGAPTTSKTKGGFGAVPQWFADAHLNTGSAGAAGDPWRVVGFGGNEAGVSVASFGPSVVAFNVNKLAGRECLPGDTGNSGDAGIFVIAGDTARHTPLIPSRTLAAFLYRQTYGTRPPGMTGPGLTDFKPDDPGVGYFYTLDRVKGGLYWIDDDAGTRGKHGVLVAGVCGFGRLDYKGGNTLTGVPNGGPTLDGGQAFHFTLIDPADLASVAAGSLGYGALPVRPAGWWLADFWDADQRQVPYTGDMGVDTSQAVNGIQFDPATNRLYLCVGRGPSPPGHGEPTPVIHVYQVAP